MIDFRKDSALVHIPAVCVDKISLDDSVLFQFRFAGGVLSVRTDVLPEGYSPRKMEECVLEVYLKPALRAVRVDAVRAVQSEQTTKGFALTQKVYDAGPVGIVSGVVDKIFDGSFVIRGDSGFYQLKGRCDSTLLRKRVQVTFTIRQEAVWAKDGIENQINLVSQKIENPS